MSGVAARLFDANLTSTRNIGVLQTTVAEVVTVEAHQGQYNTANK